METKKHVNLASSLINELPGRIKDLPDATGVKNRDVLIQVQAPFRAHLPKIFEAIRMIFAGEIRTLTLLRKPRINERSD